MRVGDLLRHVLDIGHKLRWDAERRILLTHALDLVGPALLHDLEAVAQGRLEHPQTLRHDFAQHRCALASASNEDLQGRNIVERRKRKLAKSRDLLADRVADDDRFGLEARLQPIDLLVSGRDRRGISREKAVYSA